jgi:trehalose utilization protein
MNHMIRVTVWGENVHEQKNKVVAQVYPETMHGTIAKALNSDAGIKASTVTLQDAEHGLTATKLAETDVLVWWGHAAHGEVKDEIVDRVCEAVWSGMGMIFLHSAHFAKPFKRLMGAPCNLSWREAGERERLWVTSRNHPIAAGLPDYFELEHEEMYGEPFGVPEPLETVFVSWFAGGEVFRSGLTYKRGAGSIFYFRPGHETYPTYHDANVQRVINNAVKWAFNPARRVENVTRAPNRPVGEALEPIVERGPRLHHDGEEGLR